MARTILVTGASDGIGLGAARAFAERGHLVLLHGRSAEKLARVAASIAVQGGRVEEYVADLSSLSEVERLADDIRARHRRLDVLINNAGVFRVPGGGSGVTADGKDIRFVVNTFAPYLLTKRLLPLVSGGRVINVSSAAAAPVDLDALRGGTRIDDEYVAYAQSKLAVNMMTRYMSEQHKDVVMIAVNPGSLLATKMVKEGFGMAGKDVGIGVDILVRAALSDEFAPEANVSGKYYDNDAGRFAKGHPDGSNAVKCEALVKAIEQELN